MSEQKRRRIVVVGGGIAGLSAAQAARETDPQARIYLVCGEGCLPYYRLRIFERFSGMPEQKLYVRQVPWYIDQGIEVVYCKAVSVNNESRQVHLADGSYLLYDRLIIASGGACRIPMVPGHDSRHALSLRTLNDIECLRKLTGPTVIIGGGLLGVEAAWHLAREGRPVVLIDRNKRQLHRQLDRESAIFFLSIVEYSGVRVALNGQLDHIGKERVMLKDGRGFPATTVVFASGMVPQYQLAKSAGLSVEKGIVVDAQMRTNREAIFACGDCAQYQGQVAGRWVAAMAQGKVAGAVAAGGEALYQPEPIPYQMQAMGRLVSSYGDINQSNAYTVKDPSKGKLTKLFFDATDKLVGAILIGETDQATLPLKKALANASTKEEALAIFSER